MRDICWDRANKLADIISKSVFRFLAGLFGSFFVLYFILLVFLILSFSVYKGRPSTGNAVLNFFLIVLETGLIVAYILRSLYFLKNFTVGLWNRFTYPFEEFPIEHITYSEDYNRLNWSKAKQNAKIALMSIPVVLIFSVTIPATVERSLPEGVIRQVLIQIVSGLPLIGELDFILEFLPGRTQIESIAIAIGAIPAVVFFRNVSHLYERWIDIHEVNASETISECSMSIIYFIMIFIGFVLLLLYLQSPGMPRFNSPAL